jgi:hypothetical protein
MSCLPCFLPQPRHLVNIPPKLLQHFRVECGMSQSELRSDGTGDHPCVQFINGGAPRFSTAKFDSNVGTGVYNFFSLGREGA